MNTNTTTPKETNDAKQETGEGWMRRLVRLLCRRVESKVVTVFPKGTVVKYNGIPCELLRDTPYYSETFKPNEKSAGTDASEKKL